MKELTEYVQEDQFVWEEYEEDEIQMTDLEMEEVVIEDEKEKGLQLRLPEEVSYNQVLVNYEEITQTLCIEIPHTDADYFKTNPIMGSSDFIEGLSYGQGKTVDVIEILLDQVYELDIKQDENYYYFDFTNPHDLYDDIVVIDAGHGGKAPGAYKQGIMEKDINLAILLELKELFDHSEKNIHVYYTRTDDSNPSFARRVGLANKVNADLFLSIHNNSTRNGRMSATNGTEVMYQPGQQGDFNSKKFAEICLDVVTDTLGSKKRRLIDGSDIHIVRNSEVPVALVEVGFMTNKEELKRLNTEEYQKQAAEALYKAIIKALEEKEQLVNE